MKDFHSYSIHICDASWNKLPGQKVAGVVVQKHEERNTYGRASLDDITAWIEAQRAEVQAKIDEMRKKSKSGRLIIFARLPVREYANGPCFHQALDDLPSDITAIDRLKEKAAEFYKQTA